MQPSNTFEVRQGCSWESNPTSPPAGEQHGCRWVPFNTVHTVVQTGSKYAWMLTPWRLSRLLGGPRAPPSLDPSIPVDVLPLAVPLELLYDRQRRPALEGGEDRNTDADRSRVFLYVTSTPSESRRPSSLSGIRNGPGAYTARLGPVLSEKLPTWVGWSPPRQLACPGETSLWTAEICACLQSADCRLRLS
jgi:hypothetical protein